MEGVNSKWLAGCHEQAIEPALKNGELTGLGTALQKRILLHGVGWLVDWLVG
jgi:hypothetical protein